MKAVVLDRPGSWQVRQVDDPAPGPREVLIDIVACGVCGTDLHTLAGDNPIVGYPVTPGHEFVGVVSALGAGVQELVVGDRVAVDPSRSCGRCRLCIGGHANLCERKGGYGSRYPGGFAERTVVLETSCVRLPDSIDWRAALLAEPLACVLNGVGRVGEVLGSSLLVLGGGTIGILAAYAFAAAGADVLISEPMPHRREIAGSLGLRAVAPDSLDADAKRDVVVDASGVPAVMQGGLEHVARGGTFLIMGVAPAEARIEIAPQRVNMWEMRILGSTSVHGTFGAAVDMLERHGQALAPLVTDVVALDDFDDALARLRGHSALKVAVTTGFQTL